MLKSVRSSGSACILCLVRRDSHRTCFVLFPQRLKDGTVPCIPDNAKDWASYSQTNRKRTDIRQLITNLAEQEQSKRAKDEQLPSEEDPLQQVKEGSSSSSLLSGLSRTDPFDSLK